MKKVSRTIGGFLAVLLLLGMWAMPKDHESSQWALENPATEEESALANQTQEMEEELASDNQTQEMEKESASDNQTQPVEKELATDNQNLGNLEVHFLDVGQADCILISSDGHYMLVDAGNNGDGQQIVDYLNELGITKFDYVIGTHPHEDHIGSLDTVINSFEVANLIMPVKAHTTKTFTDVVEAIEQKNLTVTKPVAGDKYSLGSAEFTILAPVKEDYGDELNDWSVGIKLVHGNNSIVMCGDAEQGAEADICSNGLDISAQVLKVGHHGSRTSSSDSFLKAVNPKYAIISCGMGNDYGHPHIETLNKLAAANIQVFRTDEQGTIILQSDGSTITFNVEPSTSMQPGEN